MASNNNGFADALQRINTAINVNQQVSITALKKAAEYFAEQLRPKIPKSDKNGHHLRDSLKIVVKGDRVQVIFENEGWYWHLVEHGHKRANGRGRVKGKHFVRNTLEAENNRISEIMLEEIMNILEG